MPIVTQLSSADALFVAGDNETTYNHTADLMILDPSEVENSDFRHFRKAAAKRVAEISQFSWRLHEVSGALDRPYWVENPDFKPEDHIRRAAFPSPGDAQAVSEISALIFSRHLDLRKPSWKIWYIEGMEESLRATLHLLRMPGQTTRKILSNS